MWKCEGSASVGDTFSKIHITRHKPLSHAELAGVHAYFGKCGLHAGTFVPAAPTPEAALQLALRGPLRQIDSPRVGAQNDGRTCAEDLAVRHTRAWGLPPLSTVALRNNGLLLGKNVAIDRDRQQGRPVRQDNSHS